MFDGNWNWVVVAIVGLILIWLVAQVRHRAYVEIRFLFCRIILRDTPPPIEGGGPPSTSVG